jgi:hypothetical protein
MKREYPVTRTRDLLVVGLAGGETMIIACDSAGGIGPKERDVVKVSGYVLGRFTSRVALMEVLASGAAPVVLVNTQCVEPDPTGQDISRGIEDELEMAGLKERVTVTGSSEKNVPTCQTGLGVTVIGFAAISDLRVGRSRRGDEILCVGLPKVGAEVFLEDPEVADTRTLASLLATPGVHEVVPVGSRGVLHEARELASSAGVELGLIRFPGVDLAKSAGPATCLVVSAEPGVGSILAAAVGKPVVSVGWLR